MSINSRSGIARILRLGLTGVLIYNTSGITNHFTLRDTARSKSTFFAAQTLIPRLTQVGLFAKRQKVSVFQWAPMGADERPRPTIESSERAKFYLGSLAETIPCIQRIQKKYPLKLTLPEEMITRTESALAGDNIEAKKLVYDIFIKVPIGDISLLNQLVQITTDDDEQISHSAQLLLNYLSEHPSGALWDEYRAPLSPRVRFKRYHIEQPLVLEAILEFQKHTKWTLKQSEVEAVWHYTQKLASHADTLHLLVTPNQDEKVLLLAWVVSYLYAKTPDELLTVLKKDITQRTQQPSQFRKIIQGNVQLNDSSEWFFVDDFEAYRAKRTISTIPKGSIAQQIRFILDESIKRGSIHPEHITFLKTKNARSVENILFPLLLESTDPIRVQLITLLLMELALSIQHLETVVKLLGESSSLLRSAGARLFKVMSLSDPFHLEAAIYEQLPNRDTLPRVLPMNRSEKKDVGIIVWDKFTSEAPRKLSHGFRIIEVIKKNLSQKLPFYALHARDLDTFEAIVNAHPSMTFVVNMSVGVTRTEFNDGDPRLVGGILPVEWVRHMGRKGVLFCFAAGNGIRNQGSSLLQLHPDLDNVLFISATNQANQQKFPSANFGQAMFAAAEMDSWVGTSFATPLLVASIANQLAENPTLPVADAIAAVQSNLSPFSGDPYAAKGLLGKGVLKMSA